MEHSPTINSKEADMEKSVNRDTINEAFFRMYEMCRKMEYNGFDYALWAYNALVRHIGTGRAGVDYVRRFINLEPEQVQEMVLKAMSRKDLSDDGLMKSMNRYLNSKK
jgi:hypothetical protein